MVDGWEGASPILGAFGAVSRFADEREGTDKLMRGRSNGERFTGGWNGSIRGSAGITMAGRVGTTGCLGATGVGASGASTSRGLGVANTGSSAKGRWNSA